MGFWNDLAFGKKYEDIAITMLQGEALQERPEGLFKEYDFKTEKHMYEVKSDRLSYKTGNLFIEYECSGKPSGIMVTKADYWFYFVTMPVSIANYPDNYRAYKIPVPFLWKLIEEKPRTVSAGENYKNKGYVIPESRFKEYRITFQTDEKKAQ